MKWGMSQRHVVLAAGQGHVLFLRSLEDKAFELSPTRVSAGRHCDSGDRVSWNLRQEFVHREFQHHHLSIVALQSDNTRITVIETRPSLGFRDIPHVDG